MYLRISKSLEKTILTIYCPYLVNIFLIYFQYMIFSTKLNSMSFNSRLNGDEPISTLTQDFHTRLDNLLRTLVHARPYFVRCIRSNGSETPMYLDRSVTMRQIRSLQVLETVNLMAGGTLKKGTKIWFWD